MPRPLRAPEPGCTYHVFARGNRRQEIYATDEDKLVFLRLLALVIERRAWELWAYCLMPNHYHLLARIPRGDLSQGMHWLNGVYARWFNETHGFDGHLFQGRFRSARVDSDAHLLEAIRYVVLNPVRARICRYPGDWTWSSYRATADDTTSTFFRPRATLSLLGGRSDARSREAFRAFVATARSRRE